MPFVPFGDFVSVTPVATDTIARYENVLEQPVIEMWQTHGYGMAVNGFIKVIDPDYYLYMIGEYLPTPDMIPVLATGMGDIVVAVRGTYRVLHYRYNVATAGMPDTLENLSAFLASDEYLNDVLAYRPYAEAAETYRPLTEPDDFEYIYGYKLPLPAGGYEGVEFLDRMRIYEHIALITHWTGLIPVDLPE